MSQVGKIILAGIALLACLVAPVSAQEDKTNAIESVAVVHQGGTLNIKLGFKKPLAALPSVFSVAKPSRVAIDLPNIGSALKKNAQTYNEGELRSINVVQGKDKTRIVLNLAQAMTHEAVLDGNHLLLALQPSVDSERSVVQTEHFSQAQSSKTLVSIRDIVFRRGKDGEARITVDLTDPNAAIDIRQQGKSLIVDFARVSLPESLSRKMDVTDFATPVVSMNTVQQGANTQMTITPKGLWEHNAYQADNKFVIEVRQVIENPHKLIQGTRGGYQGEKLSLNFQNVEVRRLLQVIGEFTGMNIVVSDTVNGSITLILKDVPWDQALDIILNQKGLDMRKNGNVILIAPRDEIATKEKLDYEAKQQISDLEPLRTESFQMNYIKGADVKKLLTDSKQTILSKRGSALLDERSNIIFVQDTTTRLEEVRAMIAKIDIPVRQVIIEARIVEAGDTFNKNLGVRLATGSATRQSNNGNTATKVPGETINDTSRTSMGGSVNLPLKANSAGSFAFTLYNSKFTRFIDAEISAQESDGRLKVVSSPRVMTANQYDAVIEQGVEIPYQEGTSAGNTSTSYKKANLALKVKPQITPDGKITLSLDINKDTPNTSLQTGSGLAIDTKHIKTEVLVENGGTVVIGGIYEQKISNSTTRVPFFGDLPYIGWLFKNREWIDNKTELIVFITPKIVAEGLAVR